MQRQYGGDGLDPARRPLEMSQVPLECRDRYGPLPEYRPQCARLREVALDRGRGMGVHVDDVRDTAPGILEGPAQGQGDAVAGGVGSGHVVGVGRQAPARGLAVDPRATRPGMLLGLQYEDPGALAVDEPAPVLGEGTRGRAGRGVTVGQGPHRREGRHDRRSDDGFGAARESHVELSVPYAVDRLPYGLGPRRAGARHGPRLTRDVQVQGDLGGGL